MKPTTFEEKVEEMREVLKQNSVHVLKLKTYAESDLLNQTVTGAEVIPNLMLAYRHLEDSIMRLGKVLQARNGGVSIYDKNKN